MKEFKLTSWSIDNRTSIFIITVLITLAGIMSYMAIPKEQFPDVTVPQIFVTTIYPCLLYTSDSCDERSRVDLGGRRNNKKKKKKTHQMW